MKKILTICMMLMMLTFSCYAAENGFFEDILDALPWHDIKSEVITGENPDKERQEETQKQEEEKMKQEAEKKEEAKQSQDVKSIDLIMIIDKSGSMYSLRNDTIGGFNSFLDEQRKKEIPVKVSVIMFNNQMEKKYNRADIKEIQNMTEKDYVPGGTTALLDAVGNTLSAVQSDEAVNTEGNKVVVVIITDGMENASTEWRYDTVKKMVTELTDKKYEFVFLGADIDAVGVAGNIGISSSNSMKFEKSSRGVKQNFKAMNVMMDAVSAGSTLQESVEWRSNIVEDKN